MPPAQHFLWEARDGVATITLNRPEKKNPLTFASYAELRDRFRALAFQGQDHALAAQSQDHGLAAQPQDRALAFQGQDHADQDPPINVVVVTGAGGNFSSGGDVHEIIGPLTQMTMPELLAFTEMTGDLIKAMRACPQPVIAAVEGVCAGAGAMLALAADLRYGAEDCRTAFLFTRVGLSGADMGACTLLPRVIGQGRAAELLLTGRTMTADEGLRWGFFNELVPPGGALARAQTVAAQLAAGPNFAHGMTKRQLHQEWAMSLDDAIAAEAQAQAICMQTRDFRRAYAAFVAHQTPVFEGD